MIHTREFQKVEFEDAGHDRYVVLLEQIVREPFTGVDLRSEGMGLRKRNINKPDAPTSFVALKVRVMVVQEREYGSYDDWDALLVRACSGLQVYTKSLLCALVSISSCVKVQGIVPSTEL